MKNLFCHLVVIVFGVTASAQKVYFVYFETDNTQPFYLKMDDKVYSSTSAGCFILPNLSDSIYDVAIGMPSSGTESKFKLKVDSKDHGFAIRNFDFGLGLYDLQSLSVTRPQVDNWESNVSYQYRSNDFTTLLAKASNDTSLYYIPVINKEEVIVQSESKPAETVSPMDTNANSSVIAATGSEVLTGTTDTKPPVDKTEPPAIVMGAGMIGDSMAQSTQLSADSMVMKEAVKADSTVLAFTDSTASLKTDSSLMLSGSKEYQRSTVRRFSESSTAEGFGLVFYDISEGSGDTISLVIPNPAIILKAPDTTHFEDGLLEIKKDTLTPVAGIKKTVPKSNCSAVATDNDFLKLRKNMAAKDSDEEMITEAKKTFKTRCFSTGQIKNLSSLFLNDEGKYQFFDAAYTRVIDQEVFYALQTELNDEYYRKRFKALIGE